MEIQKRSRGDDMGGGSHVIRLHSNSRFAVARRQKELKADFAALPIHKLEFVDVATRNAMLGKITHQARLANDATREGGDEQEIVFTLVDGVKPIRHRVMSRKVARNLNFGNRKYKTGMEWVQGKQEIPK